MRMEIDLIEQIEERAKSEHRNFTNMVHHILKSEMHKKSSQTNESF